MKHTLAGMLMALSWTFSIFSPAAHAQEQEWVSRSGNVKMTPDVTFTLETAIADGRMVFIGAADGIRGKINPDLKVPPNSVVQVNLVNGDGAIHDFAVPDLGVNSSDISGKGSSITVVFRTGEAGTLDYICSLPGHAAAGMIGKIVVGDVERTEPEAPILAQDPNAVGEPVGKRKPKEFEIDLTTTEKVGYLADGSTYTFWTFNDKVPGPFLRARVGDTITVNLTNPRDSSHIHSIDLHSVNGPGGGAEGTQAAPGQTKSFTFKALNPGLYVYHCATPMVAQHITNGMYGLILVEPEGGLEPVDKEFYVMQGELYTAQEHGTQGHHEMSLEKMLDELPEHYLFNGSMNALTKIHRMEAKVGDTVRIFFGVGGPNKSSSFHVIGEVFDRVYSEASLTSPPLTNVQTTTVPVGGATVVEFKVEVPGRYVLVDHALARAEKGLVGFLHVEGKENPEIFHAEEE